MEKFTDENLILVVQEYNHLYDLGDPNYHNIIVRENSWEEIGERFNTSGESCKNKWKSLRESYRKAMNARKTKSGQAAKKIKLWRLEAQMGFVRKHLFSQSNEQTSNISALESPVSVDSNDSVPIIVEESIDTERNEEELLERNKPESYARRDLETPSPLVAAKSTSKLKKPKHSGTAAEMLQQYINMKMSTTSTSLPSNPEDQLTKYFRSVEETVRSLPPYIQIQLKTQISQLVHNAELKAYNYTTSSPVYPTSLPYSQSLQQSFSNTPSTKFPVSSHSVPQSITSISANLYPTKSDQQPPPNQSNSQNFNNYLQL